MLLRRWCTIMVRILGLPSAHLRARVRVAGHFEARSYQSGGKSSRLSYSERRLEPLRDRAQGGSEMW
jgi:hypothetical protein